MPTVIQLFPKTRFLARAEAPHWRPTPNHALIRMAIEPSGSGPYVEAARDLIERCTPRGSLRRVG